MKFTRGFSPVRHESRGYFESHGNLRPCRLGRLKILPVDLDRTCELVLRPMVDQPVRPNLKKYLTLIRSSIASKIYRVHDW